MSRAMREPAVVMEWRRLIQCCMRVRRLQRIFANVGDLLKQYPSGLRRRLQLVYKKA